jgi:hypothetical protein
MINAAKLSLSLTEGLHRPSGRTPIMFHQLDFRRFDGVVLVLSRAGYNSSEEESTVTSMLEKAINEVQKLSASEQDAIAAIILDELADEQRWDEAFANSQDQLARMANKVRADIREGRIKKAGFDEL